MNENDRKTRFNSLFSICELHGLKNEDALKIIGELDDLSFYLKRIDGLNKANSLAEELAIRNLSSLESSTLHFYRSNIYSDLRRMKTQNTEDAWNWEQEELEQEIVHLRHAIGSGFEALDDYRKCQIFTNLGNTLNGIGRFVEAIETWDKALEIDHEFGMALGNRGKGYFHYAQALYDGGHRAVFLRHAHHYLKKALDLSLHEDAREGFKQLKATIEKLFPQVSEKGIALTEYSLGTSREENEYRSWCLNNRLFLNPLNDLGPHSIAARDILHTPNIIVKTGSSPYYQRFANQLKQEYIIARYMLFRGISEKAHHFSNAETFLLDTLDDPRFSLSTEMIKTSFRIAYSLLDKIALFLNHYLNLQIDPRSTTFRSLWYKDQKKSNGIKDEFTRFQNWPLRGLYWLGKDVHEEKTEFKKSIEPEASEISKIRNYLEHRYIHLHGDNTFPTNGEEDTNGFSYSIGIKDFEMKTLKVVKMARAAIIYLLLGIHTEEDKKTKYYKDKKVLTIELPLLLDG